MPTDSQSASEPPASPESTSSGLRAYLERSPVVVFSMFAVAAAFTAYFCMYAFRKPYAAGTYADLTFGSLDLKDALIISQLFGYALSKWLGVKFVSELAPEKRAAVLLALIVWAEAALILFAVVPPKMAVIAMFLNGLPLGAVWGLVFGFLEGRQTSEILGAGLSCSYIVASGAVKSVGLMVTKDWGIAEMWMPAVTGLLFLPIFLVAVWALSQLPPPSQADVRMRTKREPMRGRERWRFFLRFAPGLIALTGLYFFLTAYRDFRDNYAREIWGELYLQQVHPWLHGLWNQFGWADAPAIFTITEIPIAFGVLVALALLYLVKDNRRGLFYTHVIMMFGMVLVGVSTLLFDAGTINPITWMIGVGLGLYLAYVPYGCVLFDRLIAATGVVATAVFMIYVTDAAGYIGSIGIVLYKQFGQGDLSKLNFFRYLSYFTAVFCLVCFAFSAVYFARKSRDPSE